MIEIKTDNREFLRRANSLLEALGPADMANVLGDIGQNLSVGTRERIGRSRDWYDRPLAPNTAVTLSRKRGTRPLIDSGVWLASRLSHSVSGNTVTLTAGGVQAAVLHYGAGKGQFGSGVTRRFPIPWGTIPARPYMPIRDDGRSLVPAAQEDVITTIEEYINAAAR